MESHIKYVFMPLWVSCLDWSISIYTNKFTCIGWVFLPRKTHPKLNDYHTIFCGENRIMYRWGLVKGKYSPKEFVSPESETGPGKSIMTLMWRVTILGGGTGKMVIVYSVLCVLKGCIDMYER